MPIKNRTAGISRIIYEGQRPSLHMYAKKHSFQIQPAAKSSRALRRYDLNSKYPPDLSGGYLLRSKQFPYFFTFANLLNNSSR